MAMKELVERECGGANPLMRLTTHYSQDKARTQDGFQRNRSHGVGSDMVARPFEQATEEELVNEFLADPRSKMAPTSFRMDSLLREMQEIEGARMRHAPMQAPAIADLATQQNWASEFLEAESHKESQRGSTSTHDDWTTQFLSKPSSGGPTGHLDQPMQPLESTQWARDFLESSENQEWSEEFEKSVLADQKWADEFSAPQKDENLAGTANHLLGMVNDPKFANSQEAKVDDWAQEYAQVKQEAKEIGIESDADFWDKLQQQWEGIAREDVDGNLQTDNYYKDYKFEEENPLQDHPDPFSEGLKRLEQGYIPNAVLLFEAAVQRDQNHAQAWQYLGTTQAANEQEPAAIAALRKCLELDPGNLTALMSLAVSYTNESLQNQACESLLGWLRHNPAYSRLLPPDGAKQGASKINVSSFVPSSKHNEVRDLYIKAVQSNTSDKIDADVQCGLGVLFNLTGEYDKAVDCFKTAIHVRPNVTDSLLWNKLGATLAKGSRSEEAVEAYAHALELSPGYIRTRYNLGIACVKLGAYREAVEHFLSAVNLQKNSHGPNGEHSVMSDNILSMLRMARTLMGRTDMHTACDKQQHEEIEADRTNTAQIRKLSSILPRFGPDAFDKFVNIFDKMEVPRSDIAARLRRPYDPVTNSEQSTTVVTQEDTRSKQPWYRCTLTKEQQNMLCTEKLYVNISKHITAIKRLAIGLDLGYLAANQAQQNNQFSVPDQVIELLIMWHQHNIILSVDELAHALHGCSLDSVPVRREIEKFCGVIGATN